MSPTSGKERQKWGTLGCGADSSILREFRSRSFAALRMTIHFPAYPQKTRSGWAIPGILLKPNVAHFWQRTPEVGHPRVRCRLEYSARVQKQVLRCAQDDNPFPSLSAKNAVRVGHPGDSAETECRPLLAKNARSGAPSGAVQTRVFCASSEAGPSLRSG